jgi:hypothetical protein
MPTPVKSLLYTTVCLETESSDGSVGAGTAFLFRDQASPPEHQIFLVSNKHVVEGASKGRMFFTLRGSDGLPVLGDPFFLETDGFEGQWQGHPDAEVDVAVMPLSWQLDSIAKSGATAFLHPMTLDDVADPSVFDGLDVASPVLFVGYPNGMFDEKHYLPLVRRGYTASSPNLDYDGKPVFLIDASVFPGSSGSPVFTVGDNLIGGTPALKLLGLIAAVYTQDVDGSLEWRPVPTQTMPVPVIGQMIDIGVVFKVRCIREAITEFWRKQREAPNM